MRLPEYATGLLEWAYPGRSEVPCLRRPGAEQMLCGLFLNPGRVPGFVPRLLQPADPEPVCPRCVVVLATLAGRCPVCGAELVGDEQGRAPAHGGCEGAGMALRSGL